MKLELIHPLKSLQVNQAFGIFNPAYEQFGFNRHNGIDYATIPREISYAVCDGIVTEVKDYPDAAGRAVRLRTLEPVEAEGNKNYVEFMYMHAEKPLVSAGQRVKAGDQLTITDTTGFSTGNHLHISAYFVDLDFPVGKNKLPFGDKASDYCFDFSKYYQVSPEIAEAVSKGLSIVSQAVDNPELRVPATGFLAWLSAFLKTLK